MNRQLSDITLEEDFHNLVTQSCFYLLGNEILRESFMYVVHGRITRQTKENQGITDILACLGLINTYMDGTISLTRLGNHILDQMIEHSI